MLVGRDHDLRFFEDLYRKAKTPVERERWKRKINTILKEKDQPKIAHLRGQMIQAYKSNDLGRVEGLSEAIHKETRK